MKRIGLTQRVELVGPRRERRDCLDQSWTQLLLKNELMAVPIPNSIGDVRAWMDSVDISGVILTGGNDLSHLDEIVNPSPERDKLERSIIDICAAKRLPILGVCRGMQILAHHDGIAITEVQKHVRVDHLIQVRSNALPIRDQRRVNSFHRFAVKESDLKEPWKVAGVAEDGTVEAMYHNELPHVGVMWHPERPPEDAEDGELIQHLFKKPAD